MAQSRFGLGTLASALRAIGLTPTDPTAALPPRLRQTPAPGRWTRGSAHRSPRGKDGPQRHRFIRYIIATHPPRSCRGNQTGSATKNPAPADRLPPPVHRPSATDRSGSCKAMPSSSSPPSVGANFCGYRGDVFRARCPVAASDGDRRAGDRVGSDRRWPARVGPRAVTGADTTRQNMRVLAGAAAIIALYIPIYLLVLLPLGAAIGGWRWLHAILTARRSVARLKPRGPSTAVSQFAAPLSHPTGRREITVSTGYIKRYAAAMNRWRPGTTACGLVMDPGRPRRNWKTDRAWTEAFRPSQAFWCCLRSHGPPPEARFRPGIASDPFELERYLLADDIEVTTINPGHWPINPFGNAHSLLRALDPWRALRVLLTERHHGLRGRDGGPGRSADDVSPHDAVFHTDRAVGHRPERPLATSQPDE